jgi:hypothetical protein
VRGVKGMRKEVNIVGPQSKQILCDAGIVSDMNYQFLCLGVFFDQYAKRHDFRRELPDNVKIATGGASGYIIKKDHLLKVLHLAYNNINDISFFHYLLTMHSLKGAVTAMFEAFGDHECPNIEIRNVFRTELFNDNMDEFDEFDGIIRFVRNVLTHNVRDQIRIKAKDFDRQKKYWTKTKKKTLMKFRFSYNRMDSPIKIDNYHANCEITIDWSNVEDNMLFGDLVSDFQCFMLLEFCRNALYFLNKKYN